MTRASDDAAAAIARHALRPPSTGLTNIPKCYLFEPAAAGPARPGPVQDYGPARHGSARRHSPRPRTHRRLAQARSLGPRGRTCGPRVRVAAAACVTAGWGGGSSRPNPANRRPPTSTSSPLPTPPPTPPLAPSYAQWSPAAAAGTRRPDPWPSGGRTDRAAFLTSEYRYRSRAAKGGGGVDPAEPRRRGLSADSGCD
jgi:hypothetical protein